nr:unnamed protein product [Callosobruchus chinensis]
MQSREGQFDSSVTCP